MEIEDRSRQHEPIQLDYIERKPVERRMRLVEDEDGFRLIYQRRPRWALLGGPIWCITAGCGDFALAIVMIWLAYRYFGLRGVQFLWPKIALGMGLLAAAFLIAGMILLTRESRRPRQSDQLGIENGKLFHIRDGTWRARRREIPIADVRDVRLKELRSVIPWRKEIELAIHFRGRWQIAWRKRFGEKNIALGRRFYELLAAAVANSSSSPNPGSEPVSS